ncbi:OTU domain-containing protein 6B [Cryptococcus wingfieldii CBS 7118]|uniref:OTU domain-containing protein 6B n=1 Tax=Cryptococcus wingfieldii CBS 7118 TaxID=1295528 RepID=A0A1E3JNV0_9TREE|nr:OTU domain-containing protein 6B [Cryptococcus wingfieldii CBS 7118]ODO01807.1 OTU domain-containing protein 6B [Cryptococcus wingfieldii CBS 7118]
MPGSKRRALKKLLSPQSPQPTEPHSAPHTLSPPPDIPPSIDSTALAEASAAGITPAQVNEDAVLEQMQQREHVIGHTSAPEGGLSASAPAAVQGGALESAAPGGGLYGDGGGMYANGLAQGGGRGGKKKSSRQKFEERQARKQQEMLDSAPPDNPDWTAQLDRERQEEIKVIGDACLALGRIAPDGHCMYAAIGDQLALLALLPPSDGADPKVIRAHAAKYMLDHPDDFMPFLPSITGEDSTGATDDGVLTPEGYRKYCSMVANTGEWGGEPELQALSRAFSVPIHVIQRGPPTVVSHGGAEDTFGGASTAEQSNAAGERVVRISYHKRMYGLGEHYNSLRLTGG